MRFVTNFPLKAIHKREQADEATSIALDLLQQGHRIGPPCPTPVYDVTELIIMGWAGLYNPKETWDPDGYLAYMPGYLLKPKLHEEEE